MPHVFVALLSPKPQKKTKQTPETLKLKLPPSLDAFHPNSEAKEIQNKVRQSHEIIIMIS